MSTLTSYQIYDLVNRPHAVWLVRIDLSNASLFWVDLSGCNLTNGNLQGANLRRCDLTDVKLQGADLSGADLTAALVTQAQLDEAGSLDGAILPDGTKFVGMLE